jgi:hypothetical protein
MTRGFLGPIETAAGVRLFVCFDCGNAADPYLMVDCRIQETEFHQNVWYDFNLRPDEVRELIRLLQDGLDRLGESPA